MPRKHSAQATGRTMNSHALPKLGLALALMSAALTIATPAAADAAAARAPRPQGPCDVYRAAGTPCVAAHSTTRALFASYNGPLYQVMRQSDGKRLDIGVVPGHFIPDQGSGL